MMKTKSLIQLNPIL